MGIFWRKNKHASAVYTPSMTPWYPWNKVEIPYVASRQHVMNCPYLPWTFSFISHQPSPLFYSQNQPCTSYSLSSLGLWIFHSLYVAHTSASPSGSLFLTFRVSFKGHFLPAAHLCQVDTNVAPCTTPILAFIHFVVLACLIVSLPDRLGTPCLACSSLIPSYSPGTWEGHNNYLLDKWRN